ncbi:MAG: type II toxin-antitoxin system HicB family antitoxin [Thermoleophilaceae bacterium]|jgi:predicted RNase H-like HicB family nuclease
MARSRRVLSTRYGPLASARSASYRLSHGLAAQLTIVYEDAGDGWITASVAEVPGANSQGRTRAEARENVIDALHGVLEPRFGEHALTEPAADSESLHLQLSA